MYMYNIYHLKSSYTSPLFISPSNSTFTTVLAKLSLESIDFGKLKHYSTSSNLFYLIKGNKCTVWKYKQKHTSNHCAACPGAFFCGSLSIQQFNSYVTKNNILNAFSFHNK